MRKYTNGYFACFLVVCLMVFVGLATPGQAQPDRWQQKIKYNIQVQLDVNTHRLKGTEKIDYFNQSPDTLYRVFFHLYWNAFQPGSSMDVRSRELGKTRLADPDPRRQSDGLDWDPRVKDRISKLSPTEMGIQQVNAIRMGGQVQKLVPHETILEVVLTKPILPRSKVTMDLDFEAQVPLQVRRSGRDNAEGIRFSMSQWYPKMVEYDYQGWNANPYIAREFYGVWGDYEVSITLDKSYFVAAGGDLLNAAQVGRGYEANLTAQANTSSAKPANQGSKKPVAVAALGATNDAGQQTWRWQANNVHDFMWAADPQYKMITRTTDKGPLIRVVYKAVDSLENRWQRLADTCAMAYPIMAKRFGAYPYKTYTFIQGGDGGMEYPMATLLKNASIGTAIHEWMHSWYQMMMGSNESLYAWMDEGFTDYASARVGAELRQRKGFWYAGSYAGYFNLAKGPWEEPMSTHADHFNTNYASSTAAYSKGAVFMEQLGYIVGATNRDSILLDYYKAWRFKHPNPNDFIRVAEKRSGMELDWYKEYWVNSTKTIDYAVGDIAAADGKTGITVKRIGKMPMPLDVLVVFKDGTQEWHNIPLDLMYSKKPAEEGQIYTYHPEWRWTHPDYVFYTARPVKDIKSIEIDPSMRLADVNRSNNKLVIPD